MNTASKLIFGLALWTILAIAPAHAYYNPTPGRWLNRDPIQERGGENLYCMAGNAPVQWVDLLGLVLARPPADVWTQKVETQKPLPPDVYGVTTVDYIVSVDDIALTDCGSCCKLKSGSYKIRILTRYAPGADISTMLHEGAHAAADYLLGSTMLPRALD